MGRAGGPDAAGDSPGSRDRTGDTAGRRAALGLYITSGFQFGGVLLFFAAFGYWLDTRWDSIPLFTLVGAAIGGVGGFLHLYRSLTAASTQRFGPDGDETGGT